MNISSLFVIILFLALQYDLHSQWEKTYGPYGGTVISLAFAEPVLFAGTQYSGIYSSTDNGENWTTVSGLLNNKYAFSFAVSGNIIIAATDSGIYISKDSGLNWNRGAVRVLTNIGFADTILFANGGYSPFISMDYGITWKEINSGLEHRQINTITISPKIDSLNIRYVYAGTDSGIFVTTNNGATWTENDSGMIKNNIFSLGICGTNLFAGTFNNGVFRSTNGGKNWSAVNNNLPSGIRVWSFESSGTTIFAGTSIGIFRSTDNGDSWSSINNGLPKSYRWIKSIAVASYKNIGNPLIFAGTAYRGVFRSSDNGDTWTSASDGLRGLSFSFIGALSNGNGGTNIFASSINGSGGLFVSTDNGSSWRADTTEGLSDNEVTSIIKTDANIFAATSGAGIFRSDDFGFSWIPINNGLQSLFISSLAVSGTDVFCGNNDWGLFHSTDNGDSWTYKGKLSVKRDGMIYESGIYYLAAADTFLFAATYGPFDLGIFRSANKGVSWVQVNNGLKGTYFTSLAVSGTTIFSTSEAGIFRSVNYGINWTPIFGLPHGGASSLVIYRKNIFAGTRGMGVFQSATEGMPWFRNVNEGLKTGDVFSIAASNSDLYCAAGIGGIWRRPLSELTGVEKKDNDFPKQYLLQQNYPNPFNPSTIISYQLQENVFVSLKVYDILGREVTSLVNENQTSGNHSVVFDASTLSSGIYLYRLHAGTFSDTKKLVVVK